MKLNKIKFFRVLFLLLLLASCAKNRSSDFTSSSVKVVENKEASIKYQPLPPGDGLPPTEVNSEKEEGDLQPSGISGLARVEYCGGSLWLLNGSTNRPSCVYEPYTGYFHVSLGGLTISTIQSDSQGKIHLELPPGNYLIHAVMPTECSPYRCQDVRLPNDIVLTVTRENFTEFQMTFVPPVW